MSPKPAAAHLPASSLAQGMYYSLSVPVFTWKGADKLYLALGLSLLTTKPKGKKRTRDVEEDDREEKVGRKQENRKKKRKVLESLLRLTISKIGCKLRR